MANDGNWLLLCKVETRLCALPLASVLETMRPLPIEAVSGAPDYVLGLSIVRGEPVPVVDAARILGASGTGFERFVVLRAGGRSIALAVSTVEGVRRLTGDSLTGDSGADDLADLPPLLRGADSAAIASIGARDADLLVVLETVRLVPEDVFAVLEAKVAEKARKEEFA